MNIIDILIFVIIIAFSIIGFKRGVLQSLVAVVGFIAVIYLSYRFKNILGDFFVLNLPFSKYTFIPGGSIVLNVVVYESIAFIVMLIILGILYRVILAVSGVLEKLLKITIILGIPSKILGLIVGALEGFIVAYLVLFFAKQPYIRLSLVDESKYADKILTQTPLLSGVVDETIEIINEIDETVKNGNSDNFDLKLTDLILRRNITSANVMQKLLDNKKIDGENLQSVIDNYK